MVDPASVAEFFRIRASASTVGGLRVFAFCGGRVDVEVESSNIEHNPWWVPIDYIETSDFSLARPISCGQETARCPLPACPLARRGQSPLPRGANHGESARQCRMMHRTCFFGRIKNM